MSKKPGKRRNLILSKAEKFGGEQSQWRKELQEADKQDAKPAVSRLLKEVLGYVEGPECCN